MKLWTPIKPIASIWGLLWAGLITMIISSIVIIASYLGVSEKNLQKLARRWAQLLLKGAFCSVRTDGRENLEPGANYVFVSNHTSALDIPALQAILPANFRWVAKKELFKIPIFGGAITKAGAVPLDRSDNRAAVRSLVAAAKRISEGASVVIFPEGTRTEDGDLLPFKSGGLALAIKSKAPVVPVAILGAAKVMPPGKLSISPGTITICLGKPIATESIEMSARDELAKRLRLEVQGLLEAKRQKDLIS